MIKVKVHKGKVKQFIYINLQNEKCNKYVTVYKSMKTQTDVFGLPSP